MRLHQQLREMRASAGRGLDARHRAAVVAATVLARRTDSTEGMVDRSARRSLDAARDVQRASLAATARRLSALEAHAATLAAHDPQRTLERGYALVSGADGSPVTSADEARTLEEMTVRFHDGTLPVRP